MRLVFMYGPPAVGKLTVGQELATLTGFKLFHNHLTVNTVAAVFPRDSAAFGQLVREFRCRMLAEAARAGIDLIMTWAHPRHDESAARQYADAVEMNGGQVHLVQLVCDPEVLLRRVGDDSRRALNKLTDATRVRELISEQYAPRPLAFGNSLLIDTTHLRPTEAAARIAAHFGLTALSAQ